ncbi:glycosyltransferase family 2 protein [Fundidesulfovibrio soli]|uniref:glycosyltransferase family 2 protein n=1 Tax=Fundidesulfovibrio soli TaxID=2922716 RepID=UPI001FAFD18F|nr:glycosyltransferase family 2 protein [Fundidesulfovibrio soli]
MNAPSVSVIVVNYRTPELTLACLESVWRHTDPGRTEAIVVDNASGPVSLEALEAAPGPVQIVVSGRNRGFGGGCNLGARHARGEYLFFLNSDAALQEDTPGILARFLDTRPDAAVAGSALIGPDGAPQHAAARFPGLLRILAGRDFLADRLRRVWPRAAEALAFFHGPTEFDEPTRVDWVVGAAMMVRRTDFEAAGGFDESIFLYGEELELQKRLASRGRHAYLYPMTCVVHGVAASSGGEASTARLARIAAGHRRYYILHHGFAEALALCGVEMAGSLVKWLIWLLAYSLRPTPGNRDRLRWHGNNLRVLFPQKER